MRMICPLRPQRLLPRLCTIPEALPAQEALPAGEALPASASALQLEDFKDAIKTLVEQSPLRFPEVVAAIYKIASTRPNGFSEEAYLSAQLNAARHLPVHKDKKNHGSTWLIALVDCEADASG